VLRRGEVLARHAWGFANAERRIPFTPRTLFRMCSVTKQFTCALVRDACADPALLDGAVRARLPRLEAAAPTALQLCHNQSGLRDYWAVAMLHGSPAEAPFGDAEAARVIAGTRTLHFAPGTRYSYANQNFRLLSDALEEHAGRSFAELLRDRIFDRAGMRSAFLAADTRAMPDGTEGYEGSPVAGFRAAENRVLWTGDAGLGASLDDMIAWERHVDATRDDAASLHNRISEPVRFADGAWAPYGFGLGRGTEFGRATVGHGGALRGWRSHRLHVPAERISVVVLFNHMADAQAAAAGALAAVLGEARPAAEATLPLPAWLGAHVEPETGLVARIDAAGDGGLRLRYGHSAERLDLRADGTATNGRTRLRHAADGLWMDRPQENQSSRLHPCPDQQGGGQQGGEPPPPGIAGRYRCDELEAELELVDVGGVLHGAFSGFLGQGRMEALEPVGGDLWMLPCPRALDHTPPGDWTLAALRDGSGRVAGLEVGCWLARRLSYRRTG
jgi:D-aminopeptidase